MTGDPPGRVKLAELFLQFLKLGMIAFGGPAAHAGLMEREIVNRKRWVTPGMFLDFIGSVNLIPGPNSTQLTMLVGYRKGGFWGMMLSGAGFILPAALITGILAWVYVSAGHIPAVDSILFGLKPAVLAIIAGAILKLGRKALKSLWLGVLGAAVVVLVFAGLGEIIAILGAGALGMLVYIIYSIAGGKREKSNKGEGRQTTGRKKRNRGLFSIMPLLTVNAGLAAVAQVSTVKIFWIFFKIGAVLFGSGYLLVAYMDGEIVEKLGWISREQLLDAIAIGQFTPGPILSSATFVGYLLQGTTGAIAATIGIFLPSVLFILLLYPLIPRLRRSVYTSAFLDSVNMAAVAVMLAVTMSMAVDIVIDWRSTVILVLGLAAVFGLKKISSVLIIAGGALGGYLLQLI